MSFKRIVETAKSMEKIPKKEVVAIIDDGYSFKKYTGRAWLRTTLRPGPESLQELAPSEEDVLLVAQSRGN